MLENGQNEFQDRINACRNSTDPNAKDELFSYRMEYISKYHPNLSFWELFLADAIQQNSDNIFNVFELALSNMPHQNIIKQFIDYTQDCCENDTLSSLDIRNAYEKAITIAGGDIVSGYDIWKSYVEFEVDELEDLIEISQNNKNNSSELIVARERIIKLFHRQLSLPLMQSEDILKELDRIVSEYYSESDLSMIKPELLTEKYNKSKEMKISRVTFESHLISELYYNNSNKIQKINSWKTYIEYEISNKEYSRAQRLYERSLIDCPENINHWISFLEFSIKKLENWTIAYNISSRIVKIDPTNFKVWLIKLFCIENINETKENITDISKLITKLIESLNYAESFLHLYYPEWIDGWTIFYKTWSDIDYYVISPAISILEDNNNNNTYLIDNSSNSNNNNSNSNNNDNNTNNNNDKNKIDNSSSKKRKFDDDSKERNKNKNENNKNEIKKENKKNHVQFEDSVLISKANMNNDNNNCSNDAIDNNNKNNKEMDIDNNDVTEDALPTKYSNYDYIIQVKNLPFDQTEEQIKNYFLEKCCINNDNINHNITSCQLILSKSGFSRGIVHISFSSVESYTLALNMNGQLFEGRNMIVEILTSINDVNNPDNNLTKKNNKIENNDDNRLVGGSKAQPYKTTVFVSQIPTHVTADEMLKSYFIKCGNITNCKVLKDKKTGVTKCSGLVEFEDEYSRNNALKYHKTIWDDCEISVVPSRFSITNNNNNNNSNDDKIQNNSSTSTQILNVIDAVKKQPQNEEKKIIKSNPSNLLSFKPRGLIKTTKK
eukprot:gene13182-17664_t